MKKLRKWAAVGVAWFGLSASVYAQAPAPQGIGGEGAFSLPAPSQSPPSDDGPGPIAARFPVMSQVFGFGGREVEIPPRSEPLNAFSFPDCDPIVARPRYFDIGYDLLVIWTKETRIPNAVATIANANDAVPGAIGQAGTLTVFGSTGTGMDYGAATGARVWWNWYFPRLPSLTLHTNVFVRENTSRINALTSDANGVPGLTRPFFNPNTGTEDADVRALAGLFRGQIEDRVTQRLWGAESNLVVDRNTSETFGPFYTWLVGARYVSLHEKYVNNDLSIELPETTGVVRTFSDSFTTYNDIYAAQTGFNILWVMKDMRTSLGAKFGIGQNRQTLKIAGQTTVADNVAATFIVDNQQALYAQPSNVGTYRRNKMTFVGEFNASMSFDIHENIKLNMGYSYLYLGNTVRPGEQIDRTVNIQPLLGGGGFGVARPAPRFETHSFFGHILNVGFEFNF